MFRLILLFFSTAFVVGLPTEDLKIDHRFQYVKSSDGVDHLSDLEKDDVGASRFDADRQNVYHLFTRANPSVSQPLLIGVDALISITNYDVRRRTVVLLHGWQDSVTSDFNSVLVPAFLSAEDVNVIVVDWSAGAGTINYLTAIANTVTSGQSVARFLIWLNSATGTSPITYHIVGHGFGGHQAGIVGRNMGGNVAYITALDPSMTGWITHSEKFSPDSGVYTEVIHTSAGSLGYLADLGKVDFYPNQGSGMPGCNSNNCDHDRSFYYFSESLMSGGFTGTRCASYLTAVTGNCFLLGRLNMGGIVPKTGSSGVFYLETNRAAPFSRG